jgi:hypothetical protein
LRSGRRSIVDRRFGMQDCFVVPRDDEGSLVLAAVHKDIPVVRATFFIREPFRS